MAISAADAHDFCMLTATIIPADRRNSRRCRAGSQGCYLNGDAPHRCDHRCRATWRAYCAVGNPERPRSPCCS